MKFSNSILSLVLISSCLISAQAQNSRLNAMGSPWIVDDITNLIINPAYLNLYPDNIQLTAQGAAGFGPAIGIKEVSPLLKAGIYANTLNANSGSSVLRSPFYANANAFLTPAPAFPGTFPMAPHVLLGLDLSAFSLGIDLFLERRHSDYEDATTTRSKTITHFGGIFGALIDMGGFRLTPKLGAGLPLASGKTVTGTVTTEYKSEKDRFATIGSGAEFNLSNYTCHAGLYLTNEAWQFKTGTVKSDEHSVWFYDFLLGLKTRAYFDMLFAAQYDLTYQSYTINRTNGNKETTVYPTHNLRAGAEKSIDGFWIFEDLIPRLGCIYSITDTSKTTKQVTPAQTIKENKSAGARPLSVCAGVGATKGMFALDVDCVLGSWAGVVIGPQVISATISLNFKEKSFSKLYKGRADRNIASNQ